LDSTAFNRGSFSPLHPGAARKITLGIVRRPPTSCAHRLRKPDQMCELLTLSVARCSRERQAPTWAFRDPEGHPSARRDKGDARWTTSRQGRGDRRRVRTTDAERTRAPSVGSSRTSRPERAKVAFAVHLRGFHPAPDRLLQDGPPRQRPASRFRLSSHRLPRVAPQGALTRKMRLTNFCNRLPKRAPSELSDSRARLGSLATSSMLSHRRPMTSGASSGRASLDGDAPASA
jgi:hypothetical protein